MFKPLLGGGLLILWTIGIMLVLTYVKTDRIQPFDPHDLLVNETSTMAFDKYLVDLLIQRGVSDSSLVHFTDELPCYCDTLSRRFSEPLTEALGDTFSFHTVILDSELKAVIPSYPAIAVIDNQNRLRYFGPYASGVGCFIGQGNIEQIVDITRSENYFGAVINSQVRGCYCSL